MIILRKGIKTVKNRKERLTPLSEYIMAGVFALGILSGVILAKRLGYSLDEAGFLTDKCEVFKNAFFSSAAAVILTAVGAMNVFLSPLIFLSVFSKGLFYGFTAGTVVAAKALDGLFKVAVGIGIYNFLFAIFFLPYAALAFTNAAECYLNRQNYAVVHRERRRFFFYTAAALTLSALLALAECALGASSVIL